MSSKATIEVEVVEKPGKRTVAKLNTRLNPKLESAVQSLLGNQPFIFVRDSVILTVRHPHLVVEDNVWVACGDGTIWVWEKVRSSLRFGSFHSAKLDHQSGKHVRTFSGHTKRISGMALVQGTKRVLTGGEDGIVCVWDIKVVLVALLLTLLV